MLPSISSSSASSCMMALVLVIPCMALVLVIPCMALVLVLSCMTLVLAIPCMALVLVMPCMALVLVILCMALVLLLPCLTSLPWVPAMCSSTTWIPPIAPHEKPVTSRNLGNSVHVFLKSGINPGLTAPVRASYSVGSRDCGESSRYFRHDAHQSPWPEAVTC